MTFDIHDPKNIWVTPDTDERGAPAKDGIGTFDSPTSSIQNALSKASAGSRIILMPGVYEGNLTIEISGNETHPVYITAYKSGAAIIENSCWYFYDTCDLVVSDLIFKNAARGAVSVVGQCLRNRFHSLQFVNCGTGKDDSCTFYFGGSGARFNIVEECEFLRDNKNDGANKHATIAVMISDGGDGDYLMNHVLRRNKIYGYDRAIIIGSAKLNADFESGHIAERNTINGCRDSGITVACRDVQVRANIITNCAGAGIKLSGGGHSIIAGNKIANCETGISVSGESHTAVQNKIINCKIAASAFDEKVDTNNIDTDNNVRGFIIYDNTFVNCEIARNENFIIGENAQIKGEYNENDDLPDDVNADDENYITAAMSADDFADEVVDDDNDDGDSQNVFDENQESILNFMFNAGYNQRSES